MAKEQDVFQLPVRFIDHQDIEGMALAVQRNFKELERQLALLQLAVKKATGGGIKDLPDKASIWDRAESINEDGTIPAQMLNDKLVGLEHELQLADEAVTEAKIAVGAITNKKLSIDAVTAEKIAKAAVIAQKLAQEAVTEEKIAGEAITAEKIKAGAIGTAALAAGAVTTDKLDAQAVTAGKIAAGAVTAEKIQAGSITSQHINADGITANLITSGEILTSNVTVASQDGYTKFLGDGIKAQHVDGEYTQMGYNGLKRFIPKPIYTKVPTGIPNKENFETGIPSGWEIKNATISSVSYEGNYSLRLNPGVQDIKSYARTVQEITGTTTMSFWYRCTSVAYADVYEFNLDGQRYELTDDNTWRYFSATVEEGLHVFEWAINRWSDSIPTSSYMYIDDIVFETHPTIKEITGYSEEGYSYGYRTYVGVASTFGIYFSSSFGLFPDDEDIPDIWIQLPEDFKGKEFEVFLSFSDNSNQEWLPVYKLELTLLEIDKANGRFKVRAHAQGSDRTYRLVSGSLEETRSYSISGIKFTYLATY